MTEIIKFRRRLKNSPLYYAFALLAGSFLWVQNVSAQDILSGSQSGELQIFEGKKINRVKPQAARPKNYTVTAAAAVIKKNTQKSQLKATRPKVEIAGEGKDKNENKVENEGKSENQSSNGYPATFVNGIVRLKQDNRAAAGVLIEAVRIDTREMIDSTETDGMGEFKFQKMPVGAAVMFLVSSPKIKPYIFKANIEAGMKNLEFTVFPQ